MTEPAPHAADQIIDAAEALKSPASSSIEQRRQKRVPYDSLVALVLRLPGGQRSRPMVLRARDVSGGGIQVVSLTNIDLTDSYHDYTQARAAEEWVSPVSLARIHVGLGEHDAALDELEKA